ncbi:formimidoylglutamate deiminase [Formosa haliotis]|uniref:formimidoylglutamate deiminase n=1 Tax=Formosa haliotis TaxID=1555194 RepID=UPI000826C69B|nr:formimidoylglutamate deiminase [Formosa haliotis]
MSQHYTFKGLLTENGWLENVTVSVNEIGEISAIQSNSETAGERVDGYALPGFQNAHSHAFQYAMAGLAELHEGTGDPDDFWSWRTAMYDLALRISPEHLEAIATQLYAEMVRHGYTEVAEFHYLHHDTNGNPYHNLAELGERLMAAAQTAGIHITLILMFYQQGGFNMPAEDKQRRFISKTIDDYYRLLEQTEAIAKSYKNTTVGIGIHSLRAVEPESIIQLCNALQGDKPFHIHISEQLKEIEDCLATYGKRPVEWLLDHCDVNDNYHLVHATHLNEYEVKGIAATKANVVICPSTEGNLGDGLFPFNYFKRLNGNWSIGTDSHIGLNPFEELRILDYGQRLTTHKRNTFYKSNLGDSGFNAIKMAWKTGRKAMGKQNTEFFKIGDAFNAVIMDATAPLVATASTKHLCNTFVYASDVSHQLGTIINGKWLVKSGKHLNADSITAKFKATMKDLGSRL